MKIIGVLSRRARWILLGIVLWLARSAAAQYVELSAQIEMSVWSEEGVRTWPTIVHCMIGTNSWEMDGEFLRNTKVAYWFTGTNIVEHSVITAQLPESNANGSNQPGFIAGVAPMVGAQTSRVIASTDGNPGRPAHQLDQMTRLARIAWLAFCSGPCLKREGRDIFPPDDLWKELVAAKRFSDETVVFEDPLGLPKVLNLRTGNGQPVLQYRVVSATDVSGWEFPWEFRMAQYVPAPLPGFSRMTTGTNGWQLEFTATGRVTAIGPGTKPEIPPKFANYVER